MWECNFFKNVLTVFVILYQKIQLLSQQIQNVIQATFSSSKFMKEKKINY